MSETKMEIAEEIILDFAWRQPFWSVRQSFSTDISLAFSCQAGDLLYTLDARDQGRTSMPWT
jgi:hypothetical protein